MNVFKVCVFYLIVYINLLNIKSYLYSVVGNNVQEVERDVVQYRCICERRSAALYLRYLHALQAYQALNSVGDECIRVQQIS